MRVMKESKLWSLLNIDEDKAMDTVHGHAAGMKIYKYGPKHCMRVPGHYRGRYISTAATWGSSPRPIFQLCSPLEEDHVLTATEESGDYWKPFYYLLELTLPVKLANARQRAQYPRMQANLSEPG